MIFGWRSPAEGAKLEADIEQLNLVAAQLRSDVSRLVQERSECQAALQSQEKEREAYYDLREREFLRLVDMLREMKVEFDSGILAGREWLAKALADLVALRTVNLEYWLTLKDRPATVAASDVRTLRGRLRDAEQQRRMLELQLNSYEEYFPFLVDYRDAILDESIDFRKDGEDALDAADPVLSRGFLARDEYDRLSTCERNQLALDRWWKRNKAPWEIGRIYERYIGYLYERDGWTVEYHGIERGLEDFGRDLVCSKDMEVLVVQCKCWATEKVIREKHILQLYGTTILLRLQSDVRPAGQRLLFDETPDIIPVFATTTSLSDDAQGVADYLKVRVRNERLVKYPMVKCNINASTGERIYHLPFDQMYDKAVIGNVPGEYYAPTVAEAEAAGFRRAWRWKSETAV